MCLLPWDGGPEKGTAHASGAIFYRLRLRRQKKDVLIPTLNSYLPRRARSRRRNSSILAASTVQTSSFERSEVFEAPPFVVTFAKVALPFEEMSSIEIMGLQRLFFEMSPYVEATELEALSWQVSSCEVSSF